MVAHIPPDISYGLECSVECFDITNDVLTYYHRFNTEPLAQMVDDSNYRHQDINESLRSLARLYYRPYNRWFWQQADPTQQVWCVLQALDGYGRKSAELIDHLFSKFVSYTLSRGDDPSLRARQQHWLDHCRQMNHASKITAQLASKACRLDQDLLQLAIKNPTGLSDRLGFPVYDYGTDTYLVPTPKLPTVSELNKIKQKKITVLKRSSSFLSKLIGTNDVSMFIGGKEIRVEGQKYTFSLTKKSIHAIDHGALAISVYDNQTQERLFDLCWYVDNTPALDQIAALVLAVRTGDEDEIIRVGNIFNRPRNSSNGNELLSTVIAGIEQLDIMNQADQPAISDRLFNHHPGTTDYVHNHADAYLRFSDSCARRLVDRRTPDIIAAHCKPHHPRLIRTIEHGRVSRELLREPQRLLAA